VPLCPSQILFGAARSKVWICGGSLSGTEGSNPPGEGGGGRCLPLMNVVCCLIQVSQTGRYHVERSPSARACVSLSVIKCSNNSLHGHTKKEVILLGLM
jgi:hypothetical protein